MLAYGQTFGDLQKDQPSIRIVATGDRPTRLGSCQNRKWTFVADRDNAGQRHCPPRNLHAWPMLWLGQRSVFFLSDPTESEATPPQFVICCYTCATILLNGWALRQVV
jgi:hypothetical protein